MAVEFKDYYKVLGVTSEATADEIKKAFRALARRYHPDVAKDDNAEEKFKEVNEAHEVLSNAESRRKFDQLGADWKASMEYGSAPRGAGSRRASGGAPAEGGDFQFDGTGFSDFFEHFFSGRATYAGEESSFFPDESDRGRRSTPAPRRGQDVQGDILISLDEVLKGATRVISVRRFQARTGQEATTTYKVRVPRGIRAGQSIRVAGEGGEGAGGGDPGDIVLRVRYAQHPDWEVQGADLIGVLDLAPWEAVLGATLPVQTLDGLLSVKVPPRFQTGQRLRLRGKGLPAGATRFGDLYLEISVKIPVFLSEDDERLWKELAATATFRPRTPT